MGPTRLEDEMRRTYTIYYSIDFGETWAKIGIDGVSERIAAQELRAYRRIFPGRALKAVPSCS